MPSTHERVLKHADIAKYPRKVAACMAAFNLLVSTAAAANKVPGHTYDLSSIYPNAAAIQQGLHLEGNNVDPSHSGERAVLWFEADGAGFIQHSYDPGSPNGACSGDKLAWQPGPRGSLVYNETDDNCGPIYKTFSYSQGIVFAPRYWQKSQAWTRSGVSNTAYYEDGVEVCVGINRWRSYVVGEMALAGGITTLHTHTTEYQSWKAVPGAPPSDLCPPGSNGTYKWNENFYFTQKMPVKDRAGNITGYLPGVARSYGGNATRPEGTHWDVRFGSWQAAGNN